MGARSAPRTALTRRRRALPIACALLTVLTLLAPAIARGAGQPAHHLHAVKIVTLASADQSAATLRADHAVVLTPAPHHSLGQPVSSYRDHSSPAPAPHDIEAVRTRGPPGAW